MNRHDDQYGRLACLRALRGGARLFTPEAADRGSVKVAAARPALRRLRMEGLLDRNPHGRWRLNALGLAAAAAEIRSAEESARRRAEYRDRVRRGTCPQPRPRPPSAVGPLTTREILLGGGVEKLFGANLVVTGPAPDERTGFPFAASLQHCRAVTAARLTQEAKDGPQAARRGEDRQGVGVDPPHPADGDDRGPAPPG